MLSDIAKYDLTDLCLAEKWPEQEQNKLLADFQNALGMYMDGKLAEYFDEEAKKEFGLLTQNPQTTDEEFHTFYTKHIPNTEQVLTDKTIAFKKLFLGKVYGHKVQEMQTFLKQQQQKKADLSCIQKISDELTQWQQVVLYSDHDQWDNVMEILKTIAH